MKKSLHLKFDTYKNVAGSTNYLLLILLQYLLKMFPSDLHLRSKLCVFLIGQWRRVGSGFVDLPSVVGL